MKNNTPVLVDDDMDFPGYMDSADNVIPHPISAAIKIGKERPQAPTGRHLVRCVHVEPNWTYLNNRKIALYFEVAAGEHRGKTARRFYNLKRLHDGTHEIPPKSKLLSDIRRLFPELVSAEEIDPVSLFRGRFFLVEVVRHIAKSGGANSIVESLEMDSPGF